MPDFILTTKDFTILEVMFDRCLDKDSPMCRLLGRKLANAEVVFREDIPPTVATFNSRVSFQVEGGRPDTRIISQDRMTTPIGHFLPITTLRGLALLGASEGQQLVIPGRDGEKEHIRLLRVIHQPEAAQRKVHGEWKGHGRGPILKLIAGGKETAPAIMVPDDDPGPSAA